MGKFTLASLLIVSPFKLLEFFKVNDPLRIVAIAFYLIALYLLYAFFTDLSVTNPQLSWMIVGERSAEGYLQYLDIIDDTGPFSVGVFTILDWLFGRNFLAYEILGRVFILWLAIYWNLVLNKYRVFNETNYLPALIMIVLFHYSFDMLSLSPSLLGGGFLVLALGQLISQTVLQKKTSESTLLIGIYSGVAICFQASFIVFLPYLIFTGIVVSGFSFRQLLLSLAGYLLPFLLIGTFYFWNDGLTEFLEIWPQILLMDKISYQSISSWLIAGILPLSLAVFGYLYSSVLRASTINQQKQRQLLILWLIISGLEFFFIKDQASFQLLIFIPVLTYLISSFFLNERKKVLSKFSFYLFILGFPLFSGWYWTIYIPDERNYFTTEKNIQETGIDLMVMDSDLSPYLKNKLGGPFLNYSLSKELLSRELSLGQKARFFQLLETQKPSLVIDPNGTFENLLNEFPTLKGEYVKTESGRFELIKK